MSSSRSPDGTYRDKIDMESWRRYLWAFDGYIEAKAYGDLGRMRFYRAIMFHELWRGHSVGRS